MDGEQQDIAYQQPDETNATLHTIIADRQDPSLLQYVDWESVHFELDLPAGGSRRMTLEYEQVLQPDGGLYRYRYVLSTERYSAQTLEQVSLTIDLESSSGLSAICSPSHPVTIERLGTHRARISWQANNVLPREDLELFFSTTEGGSAAACC